MNVQRSVMISAPVAKVWSALTDPGTFATWYAYGGAEFEPADGTAMRLHWAEHGTFLGRILSAIEPRQFSYRLAVAPDEEPTANNSTVVEFTLEPADGGTLLTVVESGYDQVDPAYGLPADLPAEAAEGWAGGFLALKNLMEEAA